MFSKLQAILQLTIMAEVCLTDVVCYKAMAKRLYWAVSSYCDSDGDGRDIGYQHIIGYQHSYQRLEAEINISNGMLCYILKDSFHNRCVHT
jgi:hypothetical protein